MGTLAACGHHRTAAQRHSQQETAQTRPLRALLLSPRSCSALWRASLGPFNFLSTSTRLDDVHLRVPPMRPAVERRPRATGDSRAPASAAVDRKRIGQSQW